VIAGIKNVIKFKKIILGSFIGSLLFIIWLIAHFRSIGIPERINSDILVPIFVGFISSYIFYILVVYYPQKRRLNIVRNHLERTFISFKRELINLFLAKLEHSYPQKAELVYSLQDIESFKRYFLDSSNELHQTRWNIIQDALDQDDEYKKAIIYQLSCLRESILYILNNIKINDEDIINLLESLSGNIYYVMNNNDEGQTKIVSNILLGIFEGEISEASRRGDLLKTVVEKLDEDFS
jgi:hypothetical protein